MHTNQDTDVEDYEVKADEGTLRFCSLTSKSFLCAQNARECVDRMLYSVVEPHLLQTTVLLCHHMHTNQYYRLLHISYKAL